MRRQAVSLHPGDRVSLGPNRGVVRQCKTGTGSTLMADGRPYLRVFITEGPNQNQWDWPDRWTVIEPEQDDSRPVAAPPAERFMLNHCRECGNYKWVYCDVDLRDGKGPGYVCGRCRREAGERTNSKSATVGAVERP